MVDEARSPQPSAGGACPIPYPDRFHAAAAFVDSTPDASFTDETRLLFYALRQQATAGPCTAAKPWGWNVVEAAKWQSWSQLGGMSAVEAMRLFVRTLDEEQPEWWTRLPPAQPGGGASGGGAAGSGGGGVSISSVFREGTWVVITQDDAKRPLPRYEQGAALLGPNLVILGGHYGGRYLSDVWVYNLHKLNWSAPAPAEQQAAAQPTGSEAGPLLAASGPPAAAGWSVTPLEGQLLVLGGHVKVGKLKKGQALPPITGWLLDLATLAWSPLAMSGDLPCARGGHSAVLLPGGDKVLLYGGEDSHRRPLSDVHVLDLQTLTWSAVTIRSKVQPAARSGHVATLYGSSMLVFGGGSIASCYNDTWQLDLASASWSRPDVRTGLPAPRAGHSGVRVGDAWYVLGGGNNVKGCTDMLVADLSELGAGALSWSQVCTVPAGSPLSSEGISLLHAPELNLLVAFGGYNGKYHNSVSVYKLPSELPAQSQQQEAVDAQLQQQQTQQQSQAVQPVQAQQQQGGGSPQRQQQASQAAEQAGADANGSLGSITANGGSSNSLLKELALSREVLRRDLAAARQELELVAGAADAAKEEAAAEVHLLRSQLNVATARAAEAEKAAEAARAALSDEQARVLRLEAQLAEAQERLGTVADLEKELGRYRRAQEEAAAKKGSGSGLWGYISGQT